ncbi:KUP/HAK/KT family potassium transporter [Puia sp. P3]|uniref:KUP/HAK/KT family potassium transporter n=1 Tax=Puia sp. P3 TaxID=3423952 RepID=UPI003D6782C6
MTPPRHHGLSPRKKDLLRGTPHNTGYHFRRYWNLPLYTLQTILNEGGKVSEELVLGAISCVFWTLTLQTSFQIRFYYPQGG